MYTRILLFLFFAVLQVFANGADLRILYVYTEAATAQILSNPDFANSNLNNPAQHTARINGNLQTVFTNSGITNVTPISVGSHVLNADDWDESQANNDADEIVRALNEATNGFDVGGTDLAYVMMDNMADIVVLVTHDLHDIATIDRNGDGVINAADNKDLNGISCRNKSPAGSHGTCFGMVIDVGAVLESNTVLAHETGHMAGASHIDPDNPNAPVITMNGTNGNVERPYIAPDSSYATAMSIPSQCFPTVNACLPLPVYSNQNVTYTSPGGFTYDPIGSATRKAQATIAAILTIMTGYHEARNPTQVPSTPTGGAAAMECFGSVAEFLVTFGPGNGVGGPAASYEMDVRYTYNGQWYDFHDGLPSCAPHTSTVNTWFRVRAWNAAGYSNYKSFVASPNCNSGGQPL